MGGVYGIYLHVIYFMCSYIMLNRYMDVSTMIVIKVRIKNISEAICPQAMLTSILPNNEKDS